MTVGSENFRVQARDGYILPPSEGEKLNAQNNHSYPSIFEKLKRHDEDLFRGIIDTLKKKLSMKTFSEDYIGSKEEFTIEEFYL